jgi:hypothetical protein
VGLARRCRDFFGAPSPACGAGSVLPPSVACPRRRSC